jgi:hypothetical protein
MSTAGYSIVAVSSEGVIIERPDSSVRFVNNDGVMSPPMRNMQPILMHMPYTDFHPSAGRDVDAWLKQHGVKIDEL